VKYSTNRRQDEDADSLEFQALCGSDLTLTRLVHNLQGSPVRGPGTESLDLPATISHWGLVQRPEAGQAAVSPRGYHTMARTTLPDWPGPDNRVSGKAFSDGAACPRSDGLARLPDQVADMFTFRGGPQYGPRATGH
jgi:hypothetical protein